MINGFILGCNLFLVYPITIEYVSLDINNKLSAVMRSLLLSPFKSEIYSGT